MIWVLKRFVLLNVMTKISVASKLADDTLLEDTVLNEEEKSGDTEDEDDETEETEGGTEQEESTIVSVTPYTNPLFKSFVNG